MPAVVDAQDERLEEITVTEYRIVRRDFEANSPILTVEEEAFDKHDVGRHRNGHE